MITSFSWLPKSTFSDDQILHLVMIREEKNKTIFFKTRCYHLHFAVEGVRKQYSSKDYLEGNEMRLKENKNLLLGFQRKKKN